jgi:MFS family permease
VVPTPGRFVSDLRIVLRGRDFRRLYGTRLTSQSADGIFEAGLASLFFFSPERSATAAGFAVAITVAVLPYTLIGPFAGVVLDRWSRRQVLVRVNLVRSALAVVVAAMVLTGTIGIPLYVLVLACLSANRFFLAGLGASLPHVVPRDELVMANAVSTTSGTVVALGGAGVAIVVRQVLGGGDVTDAVILLLAAGCYLASSATARTMQRDLLGPDLSERQVWADAPTAARGVVVGMVRATIHLWHRRPAFDALAVVGGQRFAYGLVTVAMFLLCRATFADPADPDAGAVLLAVAFVVSGAGFFAAAFVTPVVTRRIRLQTWIVICCLAAAALGAVFAATMTYPVALATGFAVGIAMQGTKICVDSIVQAHTDDEFRGRAMSFYDMVFNITFVGAAAVCAAFLPADGHSPGLMVAVAVIYLVTGLAYALAGRRDSGAPTTRSPRVPGHDTGAAL